MDSNGLPAQQPNLKAHHERAMAWASETETSCLWKPGPNSAYEQAKTKSWAAANHHASPRRTCPQATKHAYQTLGQHGLEFVKIQILISLLFKMKPEHLQGWPRNQKDQKLVASRNQSSPKGKSTSESFSARKSPVPELAATSTAGSKKGDIELADPSSRHGLAAQPLSSCYESCVRLLQGY